MGGEEVQYRPGPQGALPLLPLVPPVLKLLKWNISAIVVSGNAVEHPEVMETPSQLRMLSITAEVEDPTMLFCKVRAEGKA